MIVIRKSGMVGVPMTFIRSTIFVTSSEPGLYSFLTSALARPPAGTATAPAGTVTFHSVPSVPSVMV